MHRVEELVVDAPVDDVDGAVTGRRAHPHLSADAHEVTTLDELDPHHPRQQGVLEVGRVEHPGSEHDDGRVAGPVGCRGTQRREEHARVVVHGPDAHRRERLREDVGHGTAVGDDVADPGRHAHVVLEHPEGAHLVADEVDAGDVHAHAVARADPHDGPVVVLRARDEAPRDDALVHGAGDLTLARVDVIEEGLERRDALHHTGLDDLPLVGADDAGHGIQGEGPLLPRVVEGHALVEVGARQRVSPLLEGLPVHPAQRVEHRLVGRTGRTGLAEHLVPRLAEGVVVEQAAWGLGRHLLAHVTNLWPRREPVITPVSPPCFAHLLSTGWTALMWRA